MKKLRLHFYIILGVIVVFFILGSFLDLQINEALFSKNNGFGLTLAAIGALPGYLVLSFIAGGFIALASKKKYPLYVNLIFYVVSAILIGLNIYYAGREFFGVNGFNIPSIKWVGYLITLPFAGLAAYFGFVLINKSDFKGIWIILTLAALAMFLALVPGVTLLKNIVHRPRYRSIIEYDALTFHNWWEICGNYKKLMEVTGLTKEEFKSFPSGHVSPCALSMLCAVLLPLFSKKSGKCIYWILYGTFGWTLLVAFSRMLIGAHFLTDVMMGAMLSVIFMIFANEGIIIVNQRLNNQVE